MSLSMVTGKWEQLSTPECQLAESPRYAHDHWMWTDIDGKTIHRCFQSDWLSAPQTAVQSLSMPDTIGCILPTPQSTVYWLFGRQGVYCLEWSFNQAHTLSPMHTKLFDAKAFRFNDGRADGK
ncbi:MAG: SMP-30/gluconolactonase/LRE family protein, partial [Limnobacter sp.]|nr:SMP-30/gluconolactonase/LRE family protein [Limnobacter sp.]